MVVAKYPVLTQTFIKLQIEELLRLGCDLTIFNIQPVERNTLKSELVAIARALYLLASRKMSPAILRNLCRDRTRDKIVKDIGLAYQLRHINRCDIIHCQFLTLTKPILRLREFGFIRPEIKLVASVRGADITAAKHRKSLPWQKMFGEFTMFLPVCDYFRQRLRDMGCTGAIEVVPSSVNISLMDATLGSSAKNKTNPEQCLKLISVSRLVKKKGLIDALNAVALLKQRQINFSYSIIGSGPEEEVLRNEIKNLDLQDHVTLLGELPPDAVFSLLRQQHILLTPSRAARDGNSEGIPNILKEGMYMGLQVIASRHAGIPELIEDGRSGFLCEEASAQSLYKTIVRAFENMARWPEISYRARKAVAENYSPELTTTKLYELYVSLAQ